MAGRDDRRSLPSIHSADPRRQACGSSSVSASSSCCRSSNPPATTRIADFQALPLLQPRRRTYLGVRQRSKGTWIGSFHMTELAAAKYNKWQVRFHDAAARMNFLFGTAPVHLILLESGVLNAVMAREDRQVRERLEVEAADEAYMKDLRSQHPKLVKADDIRCQWREGHCHLPRRGGSWRGRGVKR
ncbi:hypothetical protein ZWY2020_008709 [Hordeum vulgare]|nr:hypothetical protein ZWY2020_008709 [Hordeum vulgare]